MPNAAFPKKAAKMLGITDKQLEQGFIVPNLGNTYSACSLTGLSAVLDVAKSQQKVLICSYGSGSGSDAFIFNITKNISKLKRIDTVSEQLDKKKYINYGEYLKLMRKINID
jgi:hydroxymethylglutaryl-CoA synthase